MCDSTQVSSSGATIGTITAASSRPNKQNRQTILKEVDSRGE